MQRYFVPPEQFRDGKITIEGDDAHHAVRVMRMKAGDEMIVSDGASRTALAVVREAAAGSVQAEVVEMLPMDSEPAWQVTIAQSLPKGDKMELVIQKGTEIGAYAFVPFQSERIIVQYDGKKEAKRIERWSKIAKEAAEQSHRSRIPAVNGVSGWKELMASIGDYDLALFCYERAGADSEGTGIGTAVKRWLTRGGTKAIAAAASDAGAASGVVAGGDGSVEMQIAAAATRVLVIAGPEGGFTEREADEAETAGAVIVGLGRRILRAETAAFVALTCLLYESGEMGGA